MRTCVSISLGIIFATIIASADQSVYYLVTVSAHPPNLGPYEIGSTIALHCSVTPHPGNAVTYQWTDHHPTASITNSDNTSPNATLLIHPGHPYKVIYFCHISNTNTQLGVGSITIQVEDALKPVGVTTLQIFPPRDITLQVNITFRSVSRYFGSLTWYQNGEPLQQVARKILSDDNTSLTITNTSEHDIGIYEVQFTNLLVPPPKIKDCENEMLSLLRHYPLFTPVTFYIHTEVLPGQEEELVSSRADIKFTTKQRPLLFTSSDRITLAISGTISAIPMNFVSTFWFHNGWRLTNTGNVVKHRFGVWEARPIDSLPSTSGVYEAILWLQTYAYFSSLQFGCRPYASFVTTTIDVGNIILDHDDISLIYYEWPTVTSEANKMEIDNNEVATLLCTAEGGYPPSYLITWFKDGQVLSSTSKRFLNITTALVKNGPPYGRYVCTVNNRVVSKEKELIISETGYMEILLDTRGSSCSSFTVTSETYLNAKEQIGRSLAVKIQELCSCNFTFLDLNISQINCSTTENSMQVLAEVKYVSEDECTTISASSLINMLQVWVLNTENVTLHVDQHLPVLLVCTPMCKIQAVNSPQLHDCDVDQPSGNLTVQLHETTPAPSILIGVLCGGFGAGALLSLIPIVLFCMKKTTAKHTTTASATPPEVLEATNPEYENVVVPVSQAPDVKPNPAYAIPPAIPPQSSDVAYMRPNPAYEMTLRN